MSRYAASVVASSCCSNVASKCSLWQVRQTLSRSGGRAAVAAGGSAAIVQCQLLHFSGRSVPKNGAKRLAAVDILASLGGGLVRGHNLCHRRLKAVLATRCLVLIARALGSVVKNAPLGADLAAALSSNQRRDDARRRLLVANTAAPETGQSKTPARAARRDHEPLPSSGEQNA